MMFFFFIAAWKNTHNNLNYKIIQSVLFHHNQICKYPISTGQRFAETVKPKKEKPGIYLPAEAAKAIY